MSEHSEHVAKAPGKNRILVIRGGAIGDFILTLPVLSALRQQFPETQIEVIGYPHIVQLAVAGGLAHGRGRPCACVGVPIAAMPRSRRRGLAAGLVPARGGPLLRPGPPTGSMTVTGAMHPD